MTAVRRPSLQMRTVLPHPVSIFPSSWSHSLFLRVRRSKQFVWLITAGLPCHFLSRTSYAPRAITALPHKFPLDAKKVWGESRHIFAAYIHIVLISHRDTTSIISRYITCSTICALAAISDFGFGMMMGKGNHGPANQAVRPGMSPTPLVQQPPIVTRRAGSSHSSIPE
jgi:hypothetical protein